MAFGDYATLVSDFTGADQSPLSEGGIWTNKVVTTDVNMRRLSNRAQSTAGAGSAWYNVAQFGPDVEAYATAPTRPDDADWFRIFVRLQTPGTSGVDGYMLQVTAVAGTDTAIIYRLTNASASQIGSTYSAEWSAGDKFGIECIGSSIKAYRNTGSGWTEIISTTDSNYSTGYVGIGARDAATLDDFFAGTLPLKGGTGFAGLVGAGASETTTQETGTGVVGAVGSGVKEFTGFVIYSKTGFASVGTVASGDSEYVGSIAYIKTGYGKVGTTTGGISAPAEFNWEGVSIGLGQTMFSAFVTWTRVDN